MSVSPTTVGVAKAPASTVLPTTYNPGKESRAAGLRILLLVLLLIPVGVEGRAGNDDHFFYTYLAAANLLSVLFCFSAAWRWPRGRRRWLILASSQVLHVLSYLDAAIGGRLLFSYASRAWFGNIVLAASTMLLVPALLSVRIDRGKALRALDTVLLITFGTMLMFALGSGALAGDGPRRVWTGLLAQALLSLLALVARFARTHTEIRHFADVLSKTIWVDLLSSVLVNWVCFHWFPGAPNALLAPLSALPCLLLCYWTMQTSVQQALSWFSIDGIAADSLQPSVLTLCSVVLALNTFGTRLPLVTGLILLLVTLYAVRTHLFYSRLFRERRSLRSQTKHLHALATRDPLTGIANRRRFEEMLVARLQEVSAYPCSLLMLDTDRFKEINDSQGHPAGDALLCTIADVLLRKTAGVNDVCVCRIGGDEYAVLLPSTTEAHAAECAESIRHNVQVLGASQWYGATVSIGVATILAHGSRADLLRAADQALYRAKAAGRNAVRI